MCLVWVLESSLVCSKPLLERVGRQADLLLIAVGRLHLAFVHHICHHRYTHIIYMIAALPLASSGFAAFGCFRASPYGDIYILKNFRK